MPDADEALGQNMEQEPAQKLVGLKGEEPLLVFMGGVAPAEGDLIVMKGNKTTIRNRNAMGVGAEISQHLIGSAKRRFAVHHPPAAIELMDQAPEESGLNQSPEYAL